MAALAGLGRPTLGGGNNPSSNSSSSSSSIGIVVGTPGSLGDVGSHTGGYVVAGSNLNVGSYGVGVGVGTGEAEPMPVAVRAGTVRRVQYRNAGCDHHQMRVYDG